MELESLREKTRRDAEGINKKLQVSMHAAKLENWETVADFALILVCVQHCFCLSWRDKFVACNPWLSSPSLKGLGYAILGNFV